jgi:hypothetical protein
MIFEKWIPLFRQDHAQVIDLAHHLIGQVIPLGRMMR